MEVNRSSKNDIDQTQQQPVKKRQNLHKEIKRFKMTQQQQQQPPPIVVSNHSKRRSRQITVCAFCFISAICCLNPFTSIHLSQRVGLLLFESDLLQLRSSSISSIVCSLLLVTVNLIFIFLFRRSNFSKNLRFDRRSERLQSMLSKLLGLAAIISAISYLSLVLVVPHIKQIQRMPTASFDCNANLITIENCQQQFTTYPSGEQSAVVESVRELLFGDLNGNNERLIEKFNCLKYNTRSLDSLEVPTRFLLHNCGLVCKPHRQQVHQFSDDLNREQNWPRVIPEDESVIAGGTSSGQPLRPPYSASDSESQLASQVGQVSQVSMKVCFSGEFSGGSNYKQFCITNLANRPASSQQESELTVGQLNAMLRSMTPNSSSNNNNDNVDSSVYDEPAREPHEKSAYLNENHATQYVNPVVQFESHFKNWPHLSSPTIVSSGDSLAFDSMGGNGQERGYRMRAQDDRESYCKFRPVPPFIVNNKPFSDIQCSVEHEYTITTGPPIDADASRRGADRIYLKKSTLEVGANENLARERCNIQCKVNILYQVHLTNQNSARQSSKPETEEATNYYLPLKPCVIVSGDGDKSRTSSSYLTFRATGDTSLILTFVLLDLIFLLETIDTKQFQFESRKLRLVGLLLIVTLLPLFVALAFDLTTDLSPGSNTMNKGRRDGYLVTLVNDKIIPTISDLISQLTSSDGKRVAGVSGSHSNYIRQPNNKTSNQLYDSSDQITSTISSSSKQLPPHQIDNFMLPFFFYAIFMFALAISSFTLPLTPMVNPMTRISSIEELGMSLKDQKISASNLNLEPPETFRDMNEDEASELSPEKLNHFGDQRANQKKQTRKVVIFALVSLFMGLQFNLSQFVQMQIFIEIFGNPGVPIGQDYATSKFLAQTHSLAILFMLLIVLVFLDESSTFLATFSPFKTSRPEVEEAQQEGESKLTRYLTISLIIYAMRYYILAELNPRTKFKWLVVFLFQVAELLNFPLTWFALCSRGHELLMEHPAYGQMRANTKASQPARESRALDAHLIVQSTLALTYFVFGRFLALFSHSLHASLYLHSENVDWFITNYYRDRSTGNAGSANLTSHQRHQPNATSTPSDNMSTQPPSASGNGDSLFSPLPDERQTYLHASRLFIKYNSLLCLLLGSSLLLVLLYHRYQLWAEHRRQVEHEKHLERQRQLQQAASRREGSTLSNIDERLSMDLKRIHTNAADSSLASGSKTANTTTIYPRPSGSSSLSSSVARSREDLRQAQGDARTPRAKILFKYDVGRRQDNSSDEGDDEMETRTDEAPLRKTKVAFVPEEDEELDNISLDIPPPLISGPGPEAEEAKVLPEEEVIKEVTQPSQLDESYATKAKDYIVRDYPTEAGQTVERVVRLRNKRVRIFEDQEKWPPNTNKDADGERPMAPTTTTSTTRATKPRNISFAPTTTLIGDARDAIYSRPIQSNGWRRSGGITSNVQTPRQASPEPSIGLGEEDNENGGSEESNGEFDSIEVQRQARHSRRGVSQTEL